MQQRLQGENGKGVKGVRNHCSAFSAGRGDTFSLCGAKVLARDEWTGKQRLETVDRAYRRVSDHLRILTIRAEDGSTQSIQTTNDHPFWVLGEGWIDAADLTTRHRLLQPDGRAAVLVASEFEAHPEGVPVFNLRVGILHTYFASGSVGSAPVLAHNIDCWDYAKEREFRHFRGCRRKHGKMTNLRSGSANGSRPLFASPSIVLCR